MTHPAKAILVDGLQQQAASASRSSRITVRAAVPGDLDEICRVCDVAWKGIWQGDRDMFLARMTAFPEYGIVVAEVDGVIEGYVSIQVTHEATTLLPTWNEATDFGRFTQTHDIDGEWIHGAGLAVTPIGSSYNLAGALIEHLNEFMLGSGKKGARFITRLPGHSEHKDMPTELYVTAVRAADKPLDPELRLLARYKFFVPTPPVIFENYVEGGGDPDSLGKSALVERLNPFWKGGQ